MTGGRKDTGFKTNVNDSDCDFPYTDSTCHDEAFKHSANQTEISCDINEDFQPKYAFGYTDCTHTFNTDLESWKADFTAYRQTVDESVENASNELQLNWALGEKLSGTSGIHLFTEDRGYSLTNSTDRYVNAVEYGLLAQPFLA